MYCQELKKEVSDKRSMIEALKSNKELIIKQKKSEIKKKTSPFALSNDISLKSLKNGADGMIYPIISNTNYLDSHNDVHLNGSMSKTASEQQGKVYYVVDHKLEVDSVIATPKNVEMSLDVVDFKDLGLDIEGKTECLVFGVERKNVMHTKALKMIDEGQPQNSIRMQYVKIDLAVNDGGEDYNEEYKVWNEVYSGLANKEKADEMGYFWAVRELKIVNEGSMVLFGSNDMTPVKHTEADVVTSDKNEPLDDTQTVTDMLQEVKFNFK